MRVLIIPEDPTHDQHVLKPVVERIFSDLQRTARVDVLSDPHLSSINQALDPQMIADIIEDNRMMDLFILAVDRDCDRFGNTAKATSRVSEHSNVLCKVLAVEELEVWPLALHHSELSAPWREVQESCDPKEEYWDPLVKEMQWMGTVGRGRKPAMRQLGQGWTGLKRRCPEIEHLKQDIEEWLKREAP